MSEECIIRIIIFSEHWVVNNFPFCFLLHCCVPFLIINNKHFFKRHVFFLKPKTAWAAETTAFQDQTSRYWGMFTWQWHTMGVWFHVCGAHGLANYCSDWQRERWWSGCLSSGCVWEQIRLHFQNLRCSRNFPLIPSEVEERQWPPWVQDAFEILDFFLAQEGRLGNIGFKMS